MHIFFRSNVVMLLASTVIGCASTNEPIEPREFQSNYSYAYNLANQTVLTRNDSKLRDFTSEEAKELREMPINKGGNTSFLFGAAAILTGNLTGAISMTGGMAANIADDHHAASQPRWLVKISKNKHKTKESAVQYAKDKIRKAEIKIYNLYGDARVLVNEKTKMEILTYNGIEQSLSSLWIEDPKYAYVTEDANNYYIGYGNGAEFSTFYLISSPLYFAEQFNDNDVSVGDIYQGITSLLGDEFALYMPPFAKFYRKAQTPLIDVEHRIPAIYQSGVKHEFIKPE